MALSFALVALIPVASNRATSPWVASAVASELQVNQTLSEGVGHACAVGVDGRLRCWGLNTHHQLGDGTDVIRETLTVIGVETDWLTVSAGYNYTCGVREVASSGAGSLWCWGLNDHGQLGDGSTTERTEPTQIGVGSRWIAVSTGRDHTCAIDLNADLYCWGRNDKGQIGAGSSGPDELNPVQVDGATSWRRVAANYGSTLAVDADGHLWTWGFNDSGQLGDGTTADKSLPTQIGSESDWSEPIALRAYDASWSPSSFYSCALKITGSLWCAGDNWSGNFGNGTKRNASDTFVRSGGDSATYKRASAGDGFMCGIRSGADSGTLWCWGWNGALVVAPSSRSFVFSDPVQIGDQSDWSAISAGASGDLAVSPWYFDAGACAMNSSGGVFCWGANDVGQQGRGFGSRTVVGSWSSVSAGTTYTCGISAEDASGWCWGSQEYAEMGYGETDDATRALPQQIATDDVQTWSQLSAGKTMACGIAADEAITGSAWCWGLQRSGSLGTDDVSDAYGSPVQVGVYPCVGEPGCAYDSNIDLTWERLAVGHFGACGITTERALWCWGEGNKGQLGDGAQGTQLYNEYYQEPHRSAFLGIDEVWHTSLFIVGEASDWYDIAASKGDNTTDSRCGIRELADGYHQGTLWCWGGGIVGGGHLVPTQVGTEENWTKVALGKDQACAINSEAELWCWGANLEGELGVGDQTNRSAPTLVGAGWIDVAAGWLQTCGIKNEDFPTFSATGALYCWGDNSDLILGLPRTTDHSVVPLEVSTEFAPSEITLSSYHACIRSPADGVGCHGRGYELQLGSWFAREGTNSTLRLPTEMAEPDSEAPSADWSTEPGTGSTSDLTTLSWTLTFDEAVSGLIGADIVQSPGFTATGCAFNVASADSGAGLVYTVTVASCSDGTIRPRLAAESVEDAASNAGPLAAVDGSTTVTYAAPIGGDGGSGGDHDDESGAGAADCSVDGALPELGSDMVDLLPTVPGSSAPHSMLHTGNTKRSFGRVVDARLAEGVRQVSVGSTCATEIITSKGRLQFIASSYVGSSARRAFIWSAESGWKPLAKARASESGTVALPTIRFSDTGHYIIAITNGTTGVAGGDMWGTRNALISIWITSPFVEVTFNPNSAVLSPKTRRTLRAVINEVGSTPGAIRVEVTGYINPFVREYRRWISVPLKLADVRAERVISYLADHGLTLPTELQSSQRGQDRSKVPNRKCTIVIIWGTGT